jgi:exopolyphosphatase/guanosine-5'-triphosphate,3'-diphosphate pyrophosphatase
MKFALETLVRFRELCAGHEAISARSRPRPRAQKRQGVHPPGGESAGKPIRILSGEEEAKTAAEGTVAGIPEADGLVADLGGGSLDMVTVKDGATGDAWTLPFGPLRLMDFSGSNLEKARNTVEKGLDKLDLTKALKGRALYAVGGIWRALAQVDMESQAYPLHVLHHYVIPSARAIKLCRVIAGLSKKSLEKMRSVPKRRAEALPYGALVMEEMIRGFALKEVVVSAYGLREGVLQRKLSPAEAAKDPLIEFARDCGARENRSPGHGAELFEWMSPLFGKETKEERRVREAACLFRHSWRRHPDDRNRRVPGRCCAAPLARTIASAIMATAVYYRYVGDDAFRGCGRWRFAGAEGGNGAAHRTSAYGLAAAIEENFPP